MDAYRGVISLATGRGADPVKGSSVDWREVVDVLRHARVISLGMTSSLEHDVEGTFQAQTSQHSRRLYPEDVFTNIILKVEPA